MERGRYGRQSGTAGIPFEWPGSTGIHHAEESVLDAGDATPINANRLSYLRGDQTNEIDPSGAGIFRARNGILSDIVDSSPVWVGAPNSPYALTMKDRFVTNDSMPENSATTPYSTFMTSNMGRLKRRVRRCQRRLPARVQDRFRG